MQYICNPGLVNRMQIAHTTHMYNYDIELTLPTQSHAFSIAGKSAQLTLGCAVAWADVYCLVFTLCSIHNEIIIVLLGITFWYIKCSHLHKLCSITLYSW